MAEFGLTRVIPGHGPDAVDRAEIERRLADDRRYLDDLMAFAAKRAGDDPDAVAAAGREAVGFRGQRVPDAQADFHVANLKLAAAECSV